MYVISTDTDSAGVHAVRQRQRRLPHKEERRNNGLGAHGASTCIRASGDSCDGRGRKGGCVGPEAWFLISDDMMG